MTTTTTNGVDYLRQRLDEARHLIVVKGVPVATIDDVLLEALDVLTGRCPPHLRVRPAAEVARPPVPE